MTGPDSEGLQAEAVERVKAARKALTERHATSLAAASPIRWWDERLMREFLIQAACPIVCVGHRQPGGTDWHEWCERKADAAIAALAGVLPPQSPVVPSVGAVPVEVPDGGYGSDADQAMFRRAFDEAGLAPTLAAWKSAALIAARVRAEERQRIDALIAARLAAPVGTTEYGIDALVALRAEIAAGSAVPVAIPEYVGMNAPNGEPLMAIRTCSRCRHAAHGPVCFNMASDNDCSCTLITVPPVATPTERMQPESKRGNG